MDIEVANIVDTMIDMTKRLNAPVIGFGASIIDDDSRIIIDRIVDIIIYKFWDWTKSVNFKG